MSIRFGTTSEMIVQSVEADGINYLLAIDGQGLYLTTTPDRPDNRQDNRLADPNRFSSLCRNRADRLSALGLDPISLFRANQHRFQAEVRESGKRVNPLKASTRKMKSA